MMPILPPGTLVWGLRWYMKIKRDDVVVFEHQGKEKIKRVKEVTSDEVYVVGDFEEESLDSRHFGWLSKGTVLAKVVWPATARVSAAEQ
jgi:type IV secretory pathway protease TraF